MSKRKEPINNTNIPQHQIEAVARCILPGLLAFYESIEGQREFEEWKSNGRPNKKRKQSGRTQSSHDAPALFLPVSFFVALAI